MNSQVFLFKLLGVLLLHHCAEAQKFGIMVGLDDFSIRFIDNFNETAADYDELLDGIGIRGEFDFDEEVIDDHKEVIALLDDESDHEEHCEWYHCDKDLRQPHGLRKYLDFPFLRKVVRNLIPFKRPKMHMFFYLFKREFRDCGRELDFEIVEDVQKSGFNASLPTRIIIHGWMSQSRGSFNRDVKDAYLSRGDYNIIICDWSASASNINYFSVVRMIESFGAQVAKFTSNLNQVMGAKFDDMYLIGHSLGAQIAGAAGKRVKPEQYNTIFALDPAGPKFRHRSPEFRIDPTDAKYVESIQTSAYLGFLSPQGSATFYPNYGVYQQKCYYVGCSHIRAYKMFAESITTNLGFWGTPCRRGNGEWQCDNSRREMFRMGGEPAIPKRGIYYVKTGTDTPFALGKSRASSNSNRL